MQEFWFTLSEQIHEWVFYVNLSQDSETYIELNAIAEALKHLCWKQVSYDPTCKVVKW